MFCCEEGTDTLTCLRLVHNGQVELEALHYDGGGLASAGTYPVAEDGWYQADSTFSPDSGALDDGRFRWWVDASLVGEAANLDLPALTFGEMALGLVSVTGRGVELVTNDCGIDGLGLSETRPLIIRSKDGTPLRMARSLEVRSVSHVRLRVGAADSMKTAGTANSRGCDESGGSTNERQLTRRRGSCLV